MAKVKSDMTSSKFVSWALSRGWHKDKYGNLQKETGGKKYRFKINPTSVRREVNLIFKDGGREWMRLSTAYYKDMHLTADGKMSGFKAFYGK